MATVTWWIYVVFTLGCALIGPVGLAAVGVYRLTKWWCQKRRNRAIP